MKKILENFKNIFSSFSFNDDVLTLKKSRFSPFPININVPPFVSGIRYIFYPEFTTKLFPLLLISLIMQFYSKYNKKLFDDLNNSNESNVLIIISMIISIYFIFIRGYLRKKSKKLG